MADFAREDAPSEQAPEVVTSKAQEELLFHHAAHVKYFKSCLNVMPAPYTSLDTSRLTALYFSLVGLDILGELDSVDKTCVVSFIYSLLLQHPAVPTQRGNSSGFIGGNFANHLLCEQCTPTSVVSNEQPDCSNCSPLHQHIHQEFHQGHIAMTYTALVSLITLGDDLSRIDRTYIIEGESHFGCFSYARRNLC
jgi:geranylgeranyl transferase type-1 subunit beta